MKLTIANTGIHQDAEGRFSLNDLHRASGGEDRHQPALFLRSQQTQDLIAEIDRSTDSQNGIDAGIPASVATKRGGTHQGSYAAKEIVYAYAMWISPKFHLQVIRTFDAVVTGKVGLGDTAKATANPLPHVKAHFAVVAAMEKAGVRKEMAMAVALQAIHDDTGLSTEGYRLALPGVQEVCNLNQKQLGELIGVSSREIGRQLRASGLMTVDESGQRVVTEKGKQFGEMKPYKAFNGHTGYEVRWRKDVLDLLAQKDAA